MVASDDTPSVALKPSNSFFRERLCGVGRSQGPHHASSYVNILLNVDVPSCLVTELVHVGSGIRIEGV